MKRSACALLLLAALPLVGCTSTPDPALVDPQIACADVRTEGAGGHAGRGFLVSADGLVVTCAHLVPNGKSITVTFHDGHSVTGTRVQTDLDSDLAIVKVPGTLLPFLHLQSDEAEPGLHVRVITVAAVTMGSFKEWEDFGHEMGITADIGEGSAGAPVLADNGVVVGVVHKDSNHDPLHAVIPAWRVIQMMPMLRTQKMENDK